MKWKFVFNANLSHDIMNEQVKKAYNAGYKFMCFNDIVYYLYNDMDMMISCCETGIEIDDLI